MASTAVFKGAQVYQLTRPINWLKGEMEANLATLAKRKRGKQEVSTVGFISPFGPAHPDRLVAESGRYRLVVIEHEEALLSKQAINRKTALAVSKLEEEQARKLPKRERDSLKDGVIDLMLSGAESKWSTVAALFDLEQQLVIVNTTSSKKAEELLTLVRKAMGSLPIAPMLSKHLPEDVLTTWVQGKCPGAFTLQSKLRASSFDGKAKANLDNITDDGISQILGQGMEVVRLELEHSNNASFQLDHELKFHSIHWPAELTTQTHEDDPIAHLEADLLLFGDAWRGILADTLHAMGGLAEREDSTATDKKGAAA